MPFLPSSARRRSTVAALAVALLLVVAAATGCSSSGGSDAAPTPSTTEQPSTTDRPTTTAATTTTAVRPTAEQEALVAARPVKVIVPPGYEAGTPAPLVVLLHGFGTTGDIQSAYLGMDAAAAKAGMLLVHPDGTTNAIGKQFWNATDACCAGPAGRNVDDSAYLAAVIAHVSSQYDVDPRRVFVVGHSNGGFMAFRMACDHADVVAAIVSLEGSTWKDPSKCDPSEGVATLQVHGTDDLTIPYPGSSITGVAYPGAEATLAQWAAYNGCDEAADDPAPADRSIVVGLPPATVTAHSSGCRPGGHSELWTQPQGSHIPVWTPDFADQLLAWLQQHPKPA